MSDEYRTNRPYRTYWSYTHHSSLISNHLVVPWSYHSDVSAPLKPKASSSFSTLDPALKRGGRLPFERLVTVLAVAAGLPAVALCAFLLWYDGYSGRLLCTVELFLVLVWLGFAFNLKQRIDLPLQ